jgi:cellulose 1,4-beta-cellobiosidase
MYTMKRSLHLNRSIVLIVLLSLIGSGLSLGFQPVPQAPAPGGQSGEIQTRFAKSDWSNYTETGDYSFDPTKTSFVDWDHVTLYRNGVLVWGMEP